MLSNFWFSTISYKINEKITRFFTFYLKGKKLKYKIESTKRRKSSFNIEKETSSSNLILVFPLLEIIKNHGFLSHFA